MGLKRILFKFFEKYRIKHHLQGASRFTFHTDVSCLSETQLISRHQRLRDLQVYTDREVYPRNIAEEAGRLPYIQDDTGTLCAMAFLIEQSQDSELVRELKEEGNTYLIEEFQNPRLGPWLASNGMTVEEAKRIQPTYSPITRYDDLSILSYLLFGIIYFLLVKFSSVSTILSNAKMDPEKEIILPATHNFVIALYLLFLSINVYSVLPPDLYKSGFGMLQFQYVPPLGVPLDFLLILVFVLILFSAHVKAELLVKLMLFSPILVVASFLSPLLLPMRDNKLVINYWFIIYLVLHVIFLTYLIPKTLKIVKDQALDPQTST